VVGEEEEEGKEWGDVSSTIPLMHLQLMHADMITSSNVIDGCDEKKIPNGHAYDDG
jgi:hypothetical protein